MQHSLLFSLQDSLFAGTTARECLSAAVNEYAGSIALSESAKKQVPVSEKPSSRWFRSMIAIFPGRELRARVQPSPRAHRGDPPNHRSGVDLPCVKFLISVLLCDAPHPSILFLSHRALLSHVANDKFAGAIST
jgi:hypothetical protein